MERDTIVVCVDGSDASLRAVSKGLAVVDGTMPVVVAVVAEDADPMLVTGAGFGGGVMTHDELVKLDERAHSDALVAAEEAVAALGVEGAEVRIVRGDPGRALCALAEELPARALVMGSRGRGGIKRAVLGSVSDFVVRNAPCPVIITGPGD